MLFQQHTSCGHQRLQHGGDAGWVREEQPCVSEKDAAPVRAPGSGQAAVQGAASGAEGHAGLRFAVYVAGPGRLVEQAGRVCLLRVESGCCSWAEAG